jgi:uncharacterized protein
MPAAPIPSLFSGVLMLSFDDALLLLENYGKEAAWTRHCRAVSRVAERTASIISLKREIDARLLTVGALLHDIGRYRTQDPIQHGVEGFRLLISLGHHQEAFICASHVLCGMSREEAVQHGLPDRDFVPIRLEEKLIPLIDGMVELDRPTTLEARCASICRRYQGSPAFLKRFERAAEISRSFHRSFQRDFGVSLEDIAREALA